MSSYNSVVTVRTEDSSDLSCDVVVIYCEVPTLLFWRLSAQTTASALTLKQFDVLL